MTRRLFLMGGGGHAKMVIEVAREQGFTVECCLAADITEDRILDVPVYPESLECIKSLADQGMEGFVAVGSTALRKKLSAIISSFKLSQPVLVSKGAYVAPSATIGSGTIVMPSATIGSEAVVGCNAILNTGCTLDHESKVGDFSHIGPGCNVAGKVTIGEASFLGIGSCVIPDLEIGCNTIIGAGSTVLCNVPSNQTWCGVPARFLREC